MCVCRCRGKNVFEEVHVVELLGPEPPRARHPPNIGEHAAAYPPPPPL